MAPDDGGPPPPGPAPLGSGPLGQRRRGAGPDGQPGELDLAAVEAEALAALPRDVADYYAGGAGSEITLGEATAAWGAWRLRPKVLRGTIGVDLRASLLGTEVATPIGIAPWAHQAMAHPNAERATARGAAAAGALMTVSTSASTSLEDVAAAEPSFPRWFQLYRLHSPAHTDDLARRAGEAGYRALVLTVDLPVLGRRLRDLTNDFALPADLPLPNHPADAAAATAAHPPWTFDDVGRFAELSGLPVVVKGVLRGDDAARCVRAGAAAVWVSTHGGRQADPVVASAQALPEVVDAVGDEAEVYVDGGIRAGWHVLTALALGATAVFVGRPAIWGLATGGSAGVAAVLDGLGAQLAHTMALCGLSDVRSVPRDTVTPAR
ncbi:alpha-hydroxy-acid oxidizing protein [Blastococcus sp. CT_GayMR20]|uniref:alpha-hydroxy acid oxidase n=1 Tax=Blastococcus sp. CT_GayMR20 TaxID=2559609 RepID=UPI001072FEF0|nr:alpha-hydroxy acid oxidase [Blastococcus sp. CT_GayMR20]TFV69190.1 alpha-hydroxy-acid oxidizing protein [Blastococcus sp. CT_GayMR20]